MLKIIFQLAVKWTLHLANQYWVINILAMCTSNQRAAGGWVSYNLPGGAIWQLWNGLLLAMSVLHSCDRVCFLGVLHHAVHCDPLTQAPAKAPEHMSEIEAVWANNQNAK